ncbi:MAG: folate-binding protein YgfZ [Proteobacteria bacterium]|nr:folate-binding protein YgfZ [Pseudomonadota bacterium]
MSEPSPQASFPAAPPGGARALLCADPGLGLIDVSGEDAAAFLHGQLSSDVRALEPGQAQYSCYNTAKGRVLANLVVARLPEQARPARYALVLAHELAGTIRERLAKYVMRSKVVLADRSTEWAMFGLAGAGATTVLAAAGVAFSPLSLAQSGGACVLGLPDGRALAFGTPAAVVPLRDAVAQRADAIDRGVWLRADVDAGIAWVVAATSDQFVAQMLNWDLVGGISFRKGCYPGQEIVARMHYLGRVKERLLAFETDAEDVSAGAALRSQAFGDQSCGTVVVAAPGPRGGTRLLAVAQLAAAAAGDLALAGRPNAALTPLPLPYAVPPPGADARDQVPAAGD